MARLRDPWKALALLLALVLGLVVFFRASDPAVEDSPAFEVAADAGLAAAEDGRAGILRSAAGVETSTVATSSPKVDLLVRLVDPGGQILDGSCQLRQSDGANLWSKSGPGLSIVYDVVPGSVRLICHVRGHYRHEEELWIPATPTEQEHEVVMETSARIPVYFLTPDGKRLFEAIRERYQYADRDSCMPYLYATKDSGLLPLPMTSGFEYNSPHAQWNGQSFLSDPSESDGTLSLWSRPPLNLHVLMRHREIGAQTLDGAVDRLDIVVDPKQIIGELGTVRARVVNGVSGAPVAGGNIILMGGRSGQNMLRLGDDGSYERAGLPSGIYQLQGFFREEGGVQLQVTLNPGETLDLGELRSSLPGVLAVRLIRPDQQPIPGAEGLLWESGRSPRFTGMVLNTLQCDPSGLALAERILPGQYTVALAPPLESGLAIAALRCPVPGAESLTVEARPGALVTFTGGDEDPLRHRVWLLADGFAPAGSWAYTTLPVSVRLAPGSHLWMLVDPSGLEVRRGLIEVRDSNSEVRVELRLP